MLSAGMKYAQVYSVMCIGPVTQCDKIGELAAILGV